MKFSTAEILLAVTLGVYVGLDVLLTPLAGIETRDPSHVTFIGIVGLALLFVGLGLSIVASVLMFRRSGRMPIIAIVAALLFLPAFLAEQTGNFSSLRAPAAIERIELVQAVVVVIVVVISAWLLRRGTPKTAGR
jgi:uncharacterized membrane protein